MLPKLDQVENLHAVGGFREGWSSSNKIDTLAVSSQPGWKVRSVLDEQNCNNRADAIVKQGVCPFYYGVCAPLLCFPLVLVLVNVILGAQIVKKVMDGQIEDLN